MTAKIDSVQKYRLLNSGSVLTNFFQESTLSLSCKFKSNTTSDWLNHMV